MAANDLRRILYLFLMMSLIFGGVFACSRAESLEASFEDLPPYDNPFGPPDKRFEVQPVRLKPEAMALDRARGKLYVALPGTPDHQGDEVAIIDSKTHQVRGRYQVGKGPAALAIHPGGDHLVVANRYSNYLSIIELNSGDIWQQGTDFYIEALSFDAKGERLYLASRRFNSVAAMQVEKKGAELGLSPVEMELKGGLKVPQVRVGFNPRQIRYSAREHTLYVASPAGLVVSQIALGGSSEAFHEQTQPLVHTRTRATPIIVNEDGEITTPLADIEAPPGVLHQWIGAPVFDVAPTEEAIFVATLSKSTHHPPDAGEDAHPYMPPTQGSPNQGYQALQNEISVLEHRYLEELRRYTSASYCCPDVFDYGPEDEERGHLLPDDSLWIVEGALPLGLATYEREKKRFLLVVFGGSNQVQRFEVLEGGELRPEPAVTVGFDPRQVVVDEDGAKAFISNRLSDSVSVLDLKTMEVVAEIALAGEMAPFPATDAELGELFYYSGAALSVDGGQTCNHCHFERGNIGKFFMMPMLRDPLGSRMTMDTRGLFDTRPWYMEGIFDETKTSAFLAEMIDEANFCCEGQGDPKACAENPVEACFQEPYSQRAPLRSLHFEEKARELVGRERSFGGAMDVPLDFEGAAALLGLYLIQTPALLPNPNRGDSPSAERGRKLFESPMTGCATCHPGPSFGVSTDVNPFQTPILFGPMIDPLRGPKNKNLDLMSDPFLRRHPQATQIGDDVYFKSPSLRGIWDRAPGFLHHGRAQTLRDAIATPGHPALREWETGYNEADGIFDTHGATSHLSSSELEDLIQYLLTL